MILTRGFPPQGVVRTGRFLSAAVGLCLLGLSLGCGEEAPPPFPICGSATQVAKAPPPPPKTDYILVEQTAFVDRGEAPVTEVRKTEAYDLERTHLKTAAIRMPDTCLKETAGRSSGVSVDSKEVLTTTCGVYLKEIETAFAKEGIRVFSWDALKQLQDTKKISTYDAARELGADVVFVFNSLEAGQIKAGESTKSKTRYMRSNENGDPGKPLAFAENDPQRSYLREFARSHTSFSGEGYKGRVLALSATLDATAVIVRRTATEGAGSTAGESIWFFRYTKTKLQTASAGQRFLFASYNGGAYAPTLPRTSPATPGATGGDKKFSSEDEETSHQTAGAEDEFQAEHLELIRGGADEFVTRFKRGT